MVFTRATLANSSARIATKRNIFIMTFLCRMKEAHMNLTRIHLLYYEGLAEETENIRSMPLATRALIAYSEFTLITIHC